MQTRTDLVAAHPEVVEAWRPIAQDFDIFFGLEAATNEGLDEVVKDTTVDRTVDAVAIARDLRYGVTGNFVIDPDWTESDFERLWTFVGQRDYEAVVKGVVVSTLVIVGAITLLHPVETAGRGANAFGSLPYIAYIRSAMIAP